MIESIFLLPIQIIILTLLHLIFTFSRLITLISNLPNLISIHFNYPFFNKISTTTTLKFNSNDEEEEEEEVKSEIITELIKDLKIWKKTPKHLAIVFSTGNNINITCNPFNKTNNKLNKELKELNKLLIDVKLLINWSKELNLNSLSIYDERGILERNSSKVLKELSKEFPIPIEKSIEKSNEGCTSFQVTLNKLRVKEDAVDVSARETDSGCSVSSDIGDPLSAASSITLVSTPLSSTSPAHLSVNLLSRLSGRPHLAHIAKEIAKGIKNGSIDGKGLDRGLVEETIEASVVSEPDLLLVLGGPYLRLRGFPPWQLRLTEMHHHSSPSWLPTPPISYNILRKALDVYGGAEMRLGR